MPILHNNLFWMSPYGEQYFFYNKKRFLKYKNGVRFFLPEAIAEGPLPPAELHPPGVKSGQEVIHFSSSFHFKDIKR